MDVLGIDVSRAELIGWRDWLMPECQPFLIPSDVATLHDLADEPERLTMELRDSFWIYGDQQDAICWLRRDQARAISSVLRGRQSAPHLWPSRDIEADLRRLIRFLERGRRRSRHASVDQPIWRRAAEVLPEAHRLAGRYPGRSGPNCFGAVMGAAGVPGAESVWMLREPFEHWLAAATRGGGRDDVPGTVMVWRSPDGLVHHAAVTIGGGFALHKPSQGWQSPTKVLTIEEVKFSSRSRGRRLHRYTIVNSVA